MPMRKAWIPAFAGKTKRKPDLKSTLNGTVRMLKTFETFSARFSLPLLFNLFLDFVELHHVGVFVVHVEEIHFVR